MKISYRLGVFETNSSSIHSISLGVNRYNEKIYDGEIVNIKLDCYYEGPQILDNPQQRASYLLSLLSGLGEEQKYADFCKKIEKEFKKKGAKGINITGTGYSNSYYKSENLINDLSDEYSTTLSDYLFGNTKIFIDSDSVETYANELKELGMPYGVEYRELRRDQYRLY